MDPAPRPKAPVIVCDVGALTRPCVGDLETLARLHLAAKRFGATIELRNAGAALVELIAFAGLDGVLIVAPSGVDVGGEPDRQVEQLEVRGVDEEVHGGDGAV